MSSTSSLLFRYDESYSKGAMEKTLAAMHEIAVGDLGLDIFPNEVCVVTDTGMLDAYANFGMPTLYAHWSFGKEWKELQLRLKQGDISLAYEMVIPTDPCMSYNMASNTMPTMASVMAHAAFGHNHVFKNNYLYRRWTHPRTLADFCRYARDTVFGFERMHGEREVEEILDAAHALMLPGGYFRTSEPAPFNLGREHALLAQRVKEIQQSIDPELIDAIPELRAKLFEIPELPKEKPSFPQGNILYFIEQYSPRLQPWQKEVLRIVRTISQQVLFPTVQTKILHEGAAEFVQHYIMQSLYQQGRLDEGTMFESMRLDAGVRYQEDMRKTGTLSARLNPYTFGLAMCKEIVRISGMSAKDQAFFGTWIDPSGPTEEDREWFPWAGDQAWRERLRHAWANFNDATFIHQFLSPNMMREWGLFVIQDKGDHYLVTDTVHERTHQEPSYATIRRKLAEANTLDARFPRVEVIRADLHDDRVLTIRYTRREGMKLVEEEAAGVLEHIEKLWGYKVALEITQ